MNEDKIPYRFDLSPCPECGSKYIFTWADEETDGKVSGTARCVDCGFSIVTDGFNGPFDTVDEAYEAVEKMWEEAQR